MIRQTHAADAVPSVAGSPFALSAEPAYARWRTAKLAAYPKQISDIRVTVANLAEPTREERAKIHAAIARCNMAVYASAPPANDAEIPEHRRKLARFLKHFGLSSVEDHRSAEDDGFVSIAVSDAPSKRGFIPYTKKALNWHTDGYYAPADAPVRSFLLHCVRAASNGGENALLDPEIVYLRLRDTAPHCLAALMHPEAMTIPPSIEEDGKERPVSIGPVFAVDPNDGSLIARYTARARNVIWRDTPETQEAVAFLQRLLKDADEPLILRGALAPGEGLICNNVLHTRTAFEETESQHRLLFRARFAKRITDYGAASADAA